MVHRKDKGFPVKATAFLFPRKPKVKLARARRLKLLIDWLAYISLIADVLIYEGYNWVTGLPQSFQVKLGFITGNLQLHPNILNAWGAEILKYEIPLLALIAVLLFLNNYLQGIIERITARRR